MNDKALLLSRFRETPSLHNELVALNPLAGSFLVFNPESDLVAIDNATALAALVADGALTASMVYVPEVGGDYVSGDDTLLNALQGLDAALVAAFGSISIGDGSNNRLQSSMVAGRLAFELLSTKADATGTIYMTATGDDGFQVTAADPFGSSVSFQVSAAGVKVNGASIPSGDEINIGDTRNHIQASNVDGQMKFNFFSSAADDTSFCSITGDAVNGIRMSMFGPFSADVILKITTSGVEITGPLTVNGVPVGA
jgi:hypothetical protein